MKYDFEIENDENYQNSSLKKFWHGLDKNIYWNRNKNW